MIYFENMEMSRPSKEKLLEYKKKKEGFLSVIDEIYPKGSENYELIKRAYEAAEKAHRVTKDRETGGRFFEHPLASAIILIKELGVTNHLMIAATLLHDVLEDTDFFAKRSEQGEDSFIMHSLRGLDKHFGNNDLTDLVLSLTKLRMRNRPGFDKKREDYVYSKNIVKIKEVLICKAADRIHNLRTMPDSLAKKIGYIDDTERFILKYLEEDGPKFGNNGLRQAAEKAVLLLKIELEKLRKEVEG